MKIAEFRPATEADYPAIKEKAIFEALAPGQKAIREHAKALQGRIGGDNLHEELIQVDLVNDTWTTIELQKISMPVGILPPVLVDWGGGLMTGWIATIVDANKIKVRIKLTADAGYSIPAAVTTRIIVRGS